MKYIFLLMGYLSSMAVMATDASPDIYVNLYKVEGIQVDVSSQSSHSARLEAISLAQQKAFDTFLSRQGLAAVSLSSDDREKLIQDMEITEEKVSPTRYTAIFTVRFKEEAVQPWLSKEFQNVPSQLRSKESLLIPLVERNHQVLLWQEENPLLRHLQEKSETYQALNFTLPAADLEDIQDLSAKDVQELHKDKIIHLLERYKIPNATVIKYQEETQSLTIFSINTEGISPLLQQTLPQVQLYETLPVLLKSIETKPASFETVHLSVSLNTLENWQHVQKVLRQTPWIKDFKLLSLTPHEATLRFQMKGGALGLALLFPQGVFEGPWPKVTLRLTT